MFSYRKDFERIQDEIKYLNSNISQSLYTKINHSSKSDKKSKEMTGNMYALNNLKYQQSRINYKRNLRKKKDEESEKKKTKINIIDNEEELNNIISKYEYKKKWFRLDNYLKTQKLKEFFEISENKAVLDKIDLKSLVNTKYNKYIKYNIESCKIESINI